MLIATTASLVIGAHLHTVHIGNESDRPEAFRNRDSTPGLYIRLPDHRVVGAQPTFGLYHNSLGRPTGYIGLTWEVDGQRWAASLALASGYRIKRHEGQDVCPPGRVHSPPRKPCWIEHGSTNAHLLPIGGLSVAFPEAKPYLFGATPRVIWIGKGISFAIEQEF